MALLETILKTQPNLPEGYYHDGTNNQGYCLDMKENPPVQPLKEKHLTEAGFGTMMNHFVIFKPADQRPYDVGKYNPNLELHNNILIATLTKVAGLFKNQSAIKALPFNNAVKKAVLAAHDEQKKAGQGQVQQMQQEAQQQGVRPVPAEKVATAADAPPTPENQQMAQSIVNTAAQQVQEHIPPNIPVNQEKVQNFQDADVALYDTMANTFLHQLKHGFSNEEEVRQFRAAEEFLTNRAKAQIFDSLETDQATKDQIAYNYFAQNPTLAGNKMPSAADFGMMAPRQKLKLLYSKSSAMDMLTKLLYSGHKVVFNKSLLTEQGALRYAKQIGGTFAPVKDYDGDGMPDFLIYDKNGKIAAINGHRLKRDDKHALKRLFYQMVPDPRQQKAMGGFQGWLKTELFQVGPYDWKGERSVRVTEENYKLLQILHQRGYLSKKPESYIPRSKKSFSSTIKTHFADSIKFGLESYFNKWNKALWYLPLNYIRDTIYKIVVGTEMLKIAQERGYASNILNQINAYNKNRAALKKRDKAKDATANQMFKLLSEWFNNDEAAKGRLQGLLEPLVNNVVPLVHYIAAMLVIKRSTFPNYCAQGIEDSVMNSDPQRATAAKALLAEHKKVWSGQLRKACEATLNARFGNIGIGEFAPWVETVRKEIPNYQVQPFQVDKSQFPQMINTDEKYQRFSDPRHVQWNKTTGEEAPPWAFMVNPIKRREGGRAWNQDLLEGQAYGNAVINAENTVKGVSPFSTKWTSAQASAAASRQASAQQSQQSSALFSQLPTPQSTRTTTPAPSAMTSDDEGMGI